MDHTEVNALPAGCKESFSQSTFIGIKQKDTSSCSGLQCKFETLETIFSYFAKSVAFLFFVLTQMKFYGNVTILVLFFEFLKIILQNI